MKEKIKKGYKPSPLGPIPDDWEVRRINEIAEVKGGFAFDSTKFSESGRYQVVKMSNLYDNNLDLNRSQAFLSVISTQERESLLERGDIIITLTGTVGKKDYGYSYQITNERNLLLNQRIAKIKATQCDDRYLYYEIRTSRFLNQFFFSARGGTGNQANVGTNDLGAIKIFIPSPKEQAAIANVLSTWDKAINTLTQLIAQKELRKKWLMQQLLTRKKRLKGFKGEWKEYRLGDIFERVTRKNTDGNTNIVTISAQRGFIKQNDFFNKVVASEITENYFLVKRGEFCYNKSYSNGYPWGAIKRLNAFDKAVVTTLYICFSRKKKNSISGDFFESFFEANLLDRGLTKIAHEGGRAHGLLNVTPADFFALKISVPDIEEQEAIASVLSVTNEELRHLQQKLDFLKEQKKGLMQLLLTGKKRLVQPIKTNNG
jgi:type I restriction enzyme S subunit